MPTPPHAYPSVNCAEIDEEIDAEIDAETNAETDAESDAETDAEIDAETDAESDAALAASRSSHQFFFCFLLSLQIISSSHYLLPLRQHLPLESLNFHDYNAGESVICHEIMNPSIFNTCH